MSIRRTCRRLLPIAASALLSCSRMQEPPARQFRVSDIDQSLQGLGPEALLRHMRVLASDEFEGRAPGTRGEDLTVAYLVRELRSLGLGPGNPDGTFVQKVPLVGFKSKAKARFTAGGATLELKFPADYVAVSRHAGPEVRVDSSDLVFVGYGVYAPEYDWDDFKGVDLRGKTLVMLVNDPPVTHPGDPARLDERVFKGKAMTYYGRWTYKYEIASARGASAAIIVHETTPAGYPYQVISGSWSRENFDVKPAGPESPRIKIESWITLDSARKLFEMAGRDFDALKKSAVDRGFRPVALNARATFEVRVERREIQSSNVLARLEGADPALKDELVVYSAHWDHLGKNDDPTGDRIYNGALDNASGVACLLELASAFRRLGRPPRRSVLFLAVTAEEKGLLGARYYAENPVYPLDKTVADINMDGINPWGRTRDVVVLGLGNSTLDDVLAEAARRQGRTIRPDDEPEKGFFYRSDHFEFAKQGVPALYIDSGVDMIGKPSDYVRRKKAEYTERDYHKVTDEIRPDWDLSGAVEDLKLLFEVGYRVAQDEGRPEWKQGTEFKARRDEALRKR